MLCLVSNVPKTQEEETLLHSSQSQVEFLPPWKNTLVSNEEKHLVLGNQVPGHFYYYFFLLGHFRKQINPKHLQGFLSLKIQVSKT